MNKEISTIIEAMKLRFTSGNSVPVERTSIRKPEWDVIMALILKSERCITAEDALQKLNKELEAALDYTPGAVRVREGNGPENLAASIAVTLSALSKKAAGVK